MRIGRNRSESAGLNEQKKCASAGWKQKRNCGKLDSNEKNGCANETKNGVSAIASSLAQAGSAEGKWEGGIETIVGHEPADRFNPNAVEFPISSVTRRISPPGCGDGHFPRDCKNKGNYHQDFEIESLPGRR